MNPTWFWWVVVFLNCQARGDEKQTKATGRSCSANGSTLAANLGVILSCPSLSSTKVIYLLLPLLPPEYYLNPTAPATASLQSLISSFLDNVYNSLLTEHSVYSFVLPGPSSLTRFSNSENFIPLSINKLKTHLNTCTLTSLSHAYSFTMTFVLKCYDFKMERLKYV